MIITTMLILIFSAISILFLSVNNNLTRKLKQFSLIISILVIIVMGLNIVYSLELYEAGPLLRKAKITTINYKILEIKAALGYSDYDKTAFNLQVLSGSEYFDIDVIGYDNLSALLILLTAIITPVAIVSCNRADMMASVLIVEALLIGSFFTQNLLTFYVLFESVLIPMFYLIGVAGSGTSKSRWPAAFRLFIYTLAGSLFMLLSIIYIFLEAGTLNWYSLIKNSMFLTLKREHSLPVLELIERYRFYINQPYIDIYADQIVFWFFFLTIAVKVPMIPLHIWLPEAHTLAPTSGSIILAALVLKLGAYAFIKWLMPMYPYYVYIYSPYFFILCAIGAIYGALTCLRQIDIKRIIAYSSIVHMNIVLFSIFAFNELSINGACFELFSHGLISAGLFYLIGCLYNRHNTRVIKYFSGLSTTMPLFSFILLIFILANSAFPLTSGYIGEMMMFIGNLQQSILLTCVLSIATLINAAYNLWLYNRIVFGKPSYYIDKYNDLTKLEFYTLLYLLSWIIILGFYPELILAIA